MQKRMINIDHAKALGIIFICLGHFLPAGCLPKVLLYSFHVPLFFFISGFLNPYSMISTSQFLNKTKSLSKRILVPYLTWYAISALFFLLPGRLSIQDAIIHLFFLEGDMIWNRALWFLPCYFIVSVSFHFLRFIMRERVRLLFLSGMGLYCISAIFYKLDVSIPVLGIDKSILMLGFMLTGYACRGLIQRISTSIKYVILSTLIFIMLALASAWINRGNNISILNLDYNNIFYFIPAACVLCVSFIIACNLLPRIYVLELLSRNSLFIMASHYFALWLFHFLWGKPTVYTGIISAFVLSMMYVFLLLLMDRYITSPGAIRRLSALGFQFSWSDSAH